MYLVKQNGDKIVYDCQAIMQKAHTEALYKVLTKGMKYADAFKEGLTFAWQCAKLSMQDYSIVDGVVKVKISTPSKPMFSLTSQW